MSVSLEQGKRLLGGIKRSIFDNGLATQLPEAYKKFWKEWKLTRPTAVHYIPKTDKWERDEMTGEVKLIQDVPIPLLHVPEADEGIWGGEAIIKGFQKRNPLKRRVPHFWTPILRRSVVYSSVLNQYMSVTVTDRTIRLINESHGFDHYLLKTPACDLRSTLALSLKRKILQALQSGCPDLNDSPQKQKEITQEYKRYLDQYTSEEIEWYGLTFSEAIKKLQEKIKAENPIIPQKIEFRKKLLEQLKESQLSSEGSENEDLSASSQQQHIQNSSSWLAKINPFGKKQET